MASKSGSGQTFTAAMALKKCLRFFMAAAIFAALVSYGISRLFTEDVVIRTQETAQEQLDGLWRSYKYHFIENGRVVRPKNEYDTVSEGQAYGMLRACWQKDREAFDAIYRWSEENLSRLRNHGDSLLSWRYGPNKLGGMEVLDANPALDADLDYALALFIAARIWPDGRGPVGLPAYRAKALAVADSIMAKAVHLHPTGELVMLPWPFMGNRDDGRDILVNPSYFSPGHYRVFEKETGNSRWGKLATDTYRQIGRLLGVDGGSVPAGDKVVTVPDWILMRADGSFATDPSRGYVSGWDAFRLWWRIRLDYEITGNPQVRTLVESRLVPFLNKSMDESGGDVASVSDMSGVPTAKEANAGMAAVYRWSVRDFAPALARTMQRQAMRRLREDRGNYFFQTPEDYYTNSWAWFAMLEGGLNFPFSRLWGIEAETGTSAAEARKR